MAHIESGRSRQVQLLGSSLFSSIADIYALQSISAGNLGLARSSPWRLRWNRDLADWKRKGHMCGSDFRE